MIDLDELKRLAGLVTPGPDRWKERSRTFKGIAEAMADQWGSYVLSAGANRVLALRAGEVGK